MSASLVLRLSRLSLNGTGLRLRCISTQAGPLAFRATSMLGAEPIKKKRRIDVGQVMQREAKKLRRLEKAIRKLESKGRILKPIDEIEGTPEIWKTADARKRHVEPLTFEESERRALLQKEWCRHKYRQHIQDLQIITRAVSCQQRALDELRMESEDLYQQAIQIDPDLVPIKIKGPTLTPPIKGYEPPDGEYIDTTKVFDK